MDPATIFGLATAAIGLIPMCAQGFDFISSLISAKDDNAELMLLFSAHEVTFRSWRRVIRLDDRLPPQAAVENLKRTLPEHLLEIVLIYLILLSNAFADARNYTLYGIGPKHGILPSIEALPIDAKSWARDYKSLVLKRQQHMNILRRTKFVLHDSKKLQQLITKIGTFLNDLFQRSTYFHQVATIERASLDVVSDTRPQTAANSPGVPQLLNSMNNLQGTVTNTAGISIARMTAEFASRARSTELEHFVELPNKYWRPQNHNGSWSVMIRNEVTGTMVTGLHTNPISFYYIEWKSYADQFGQPDRMLESNIKRLAKMASLSNPPAVFRVLRCLGAIHEPHRMRFGLVYELPPHIKQFPSSTVPRDEVPKRRKPTTLWHLLRDPSSTPEGFDLSARIDCMRKIAHSLLLLHTAKWVHKNICSESIVVFRARSETGLMPSLRGRLDFSSPYLCGFGYSRPEPLLYQKPTRASDDMDMPAYVRAQNGGRQVMLRVPNSQYTPHSINVMNKNQAQRLFSLNIYQHPHKRDDPNTFYQTKFDVYSLGCVMLEVGLWESLSSLAPKDANPYQCRDRFLELVRTELPNAAGKIYAGAAERCLSITENDDDNAGRECLHRLVEDLSRIVI